MDNKQLNEYLNNTEFFKLRDFYKTSNKYKNYKNGKFDNIKNVWEAATSLNFFDLYEDYSSYSWWHNCLLSNIYNEKSKANLRHLKTCINEKMRVSIINWLDNNFDLNENEKRSFSIKFYLEYYKDINETMTDILKDTILI